MKAIFSRKLYGEYLTSLSHKISRYIKSQTEQTNKDGHTKAYMCEVVSNFVKSALNY
jgi:hypothetical protein